MIQQLYHTDLQPKSKDGTIIKPLDLVITGEIPQHYWQDPNFTNLKNYQGCYGLVTYSEADMGTVCSPWSYGRKGHPGWVDLDGSHVNVLCRRISDNSVTSYDFWLPTISLTKIPYNSLIMNIFADYPWQMQDTEGPSSTFFIREGMEEFAHIKKIMDTPYERLVEAHDKAMDIIGSTNV